MLKIPIHDFAFILLTNKHKNLNETINSLQELREKNNKFKIQMIDMSYFDGRELAEVGIVQLNKLVDGLRKINSSTVIYVIAEDIHYIDVLVALKDKFDLPIFYVLNGVVIGAI